MRFDTDKRVQFINRHFDKILVSRMILACMGIQLGLVWVASSFAGSDSQRVLSLLTRFSDTLSNITLALVGSLGALLTAALKSGQRGSDNPPAGGMSVTTEAVVSPPEKAENSG